LPIVNSAASEIAPAVDAIGQLVLATSLDPST
jgi:hypothetical protein